MDNRKTLVLYTFHKYDNNVNFFIKNGIFKDNNVDFIMIINDENLKIDVPDYVNVINRKNIGYDFGAWSDGLLINNLYKNYDYFIFANSSVIGPIVPKYYKNKWINIFLDGLTDTIKLYGSTINTCTGFTCNPNDDSHVQSYVFCMNRNTLDFLIKKEIFSQTNIISEYQNVVEYKEIRMSREIINNNWNIGCIFHHYDNIDFRNLDNVDKNIFLDNITVKKYYDENINPYEVIFVKEKYILNKPWINNYIHNIENFSTSNKQKNYWNLLMIIVVFGVLYLIIKKIN